MNNKEILEIINKLEMFRFSNVYTDEQIEKDKKNLNNLKKQLTIPVVGFSEEELPNIESFEFLGWCLANGYRKTSFGNILTRNGFDYSIENVYQHYCNTLEFGN